MELNIDIIRKLIKTSHPTFANLFDIFNTKQVDNQSAGELLEQIRAKVNSSIPPEISVDDLNTIVVINSLSDPILKEKILTFKCQNENSNIEHISIIINKDRSAKTIKNYQKKPVSIPSQRPRRKKERREAPPPQKPKTNSNNVERISSNYKPEVDDCIPSVVTFTPPSDSAPDLAPPDPSRKETYVPPNSAKAVSNARRTSTCRLLGNISQNVENNHEYTRVVFHPDTGCSCAIIPLEVAEASKLDIENLDEDEPTCLDIQGKPLDIRGQVSAYAHIDSISQPLHFRAIVVAGLGDRDVKTII